MLSFGAFIVCEPPVLKTSRKKNRITPDMRAEWPMAAAALAVVATYWAGRALIATCSLIHIICRLILGGFTRKSRVPANIYDGRRYVRAKPLVEKDVQTSEAQKDVQTSEAHGQLPLVVVTGGAGMLGFAIAQDLLRCQKYRLVIIDRTEPSEARRLPVPYFVADLAHAEMKALDRAFSGADGVIHTAGLVDLTMDAGATHNAHLVGTARVLAAAQRAGARAFVITSSIGAVTTPYLEAPQCNLPDDYLPPGYAEGEFPFPSSYSQTKLAAERMALESRDSRRSVPSPFHVVALRCPMSMPMAGLEPTSFLASACRALSLSKGTRSRSLCPRSIQSLAWMIRSSSHRFYLAK